MSKRIPTTVTNSERSAYQACRFRWLLCHGLGLHPVRKALPLVLGNIWHEAMDLWWKEPLASALPASKDRLFRRIAETRSELESESSGFSTRQQQFPTWDHEDLDEARELLGGMLDGYDRHWLPRKDDLTVLASELRVTAPTMTAGENESPVAWMTGTVDKLVEDQFGQLWVVEHKTASDSKPLRSWAETHEYSPQALTYAYMLACSPEIGRRPVGVIYDLAAKALPPTIDQFKTAYKDTRLSKVLPKHTSADDFIWALRHYGFSLDDQAWYRERLAELEKQSNSLFHREWVRFQWDENMVRLGRELYHACMELRHAHRAVDAVMQALTDGRRPWELNDLDAHEVAHLAARRLCGRFQRNHTSCYLWGRTCDHMDACRFMSLDAFESMTIKEPHK